MASEREESLLDRFWLAMFLEAVRCLDEGVASARDVDLALRAGAGLPEGPLERADRIGLDQVLARLEALRAALGPRFEPPARLVAMVAEGRLGVATGRGFHEH